jgi:hypothetical protein
MEPSVVCWLDGASARSQVAEWRALLASIVATVEWTSPTSVTMELHPDSGSLATLVALVKREAACCAFFRFTLEIDERGSRLAVAVPADATSILQDFVSLASR